MKQGSIVAAMLWMAILSILLFWLPLLGPLIAGFVGGQVAGSAARGLQAALIPVAILCLLIAVVGTALTGFPLIGVVFSMGLFVVLVVQCLPLLIAALVGGLLA